MRILLLLLLLGGCAGEPGTVDRLDCNACHAADYDLFHTGSGYSRSCYECHGTLAWYPANADHSRFPINAAPHAGYDCSDCHRAGGAYTDVGNLGCTTCHAHSEARLAPVHRGMGQYVYDSASCYGCHPQGRRGGD